MLQRLSIQNYALIDRLELHFDKGFNIITGETGAGKSILLGALSLILGHRAESSALLDAARKSIVEGEFSCSMNQAQLRTFFNEHELDVHDDSVILRREITTEGKSRAFVNDTPVNLQQLRELGTLLVDVHSQHETLLLNKSGFQLSTVDAFAGVDSDVNEYRKNYQVWLRRLQALNELKRIEEKAKADQDYFRFQFNELEEANLIASEQETVEAELQKLSHTEEISAGLSVAQNLISGNDGNVVHTLHQLGLQINHLANYHSSLAPLSERIKSMEIELKDVSTEIESIMSEVYPDPARLEILNDRINLLNRLQQKHRVNSADQLIQVREDFKSKLSGIGELEEQIISAEKECAKMKQSLFSLAQQISEHRNKTIPELELKIKKLLKEVGMPNAILKIENTLLSGNEIGPSGLDNIRFLFSANKGVAYSDISKVASGGELSRLMLCLKSSVAKLIDLPTLIFDEIDTGVSGETAFKIGRLMQEMASKHQLIVITHLPQIAGKGEKHFFVFKEVLAKKTFTRVKSLTGNERVTELARMLSGDKPSEVAMENARELMKA